MPDGSITVDGQHVGTVAITVGTGPRLGAPDLTASAPRLPAQTFPPPQDLGEEPPPTDVEPYRQLRPLRRGHPTETSPAITAGEAVAEQFGRGAKEGFGNQPLLLIEVRDIRVPRGRLRGNAAHICDDGEKSPGGLTPPGDCVYAAWQVTTAGDCKPRPKRGRLSYTG